MGINITGSRTGSLYPHYSHDADEQEWGLAVGNPDDIHVLYGTRDALVTELLKGMDALMNPDDFLGASPYHPDDDPEPLDPDWTPDLPVIRVPADDGGDYDTYWLSLHLPLTEASGLVEQAVHEATADNAHPTDEPEADLLTLVTAKLRPHGIIPLPAVSTQVTL